MLISQTYLHRKTLHPYGVRTGKLRCPIVLFAYLPKGSMLVWTLHHIQRNIHNFASMPTSKFLIVKILTRPLQCLHLYIS
jgi:hypothetical protein